MLRWSIYKWYNVIFIESFSNYQKKKTGCQTNRWRIDNTMTKWKARIEPNNYYLTTSERVLLNANSAIFSAIFWREQVNLQWADDKVRFVLDQHAEFDLYSASSQKQQSAGRHVAPLGHIILIPSQPVFALSP
jgi:hypothetical protein